MSPAPSFLPDIAEVYERLLVPMIFAPYATDIAERVADLKPRRVLEVAAGTGVVTRAMSRRLDASVAITATDFSPAMLERATGVGTARPVDWQPADAMNLPFADASFDVVVCQFGAMFLPDKARAFAEARRVLRDGGMLLFSVWDRIEENEFADVVEAALAEVFPHDPPRFMRRVPHGYFDTYTITRDLANAGFTKQPVISTIAARSPAESAHVAATAYCHGTPLRTEIESRDALQLATATAAATVAVARRFGPGAIDGKIQAHVVSVAR